MALDLSTLTAQEQITAVYIGYYDRAPDPEGLDFWLNTLGSSHTADTAAKDFDGDNIWDIEEVASDFSGQAETSAAYSFFDNPTPEAANAFISQVFLNLFNRSPDTAGLEFWSNQLQSSLAGDASALDVGEIILAIIAGAQDSEAGNDRSTIINKINVGEAWTNAADDAGIDYANDAAAQGSATGILNGVNSTSASVTAALADIDGFFGGSGGNDGQTFFLDITTDRITGTADNDFFDAGIVQNPFGGVANSLSSADRLDGGNGRDTLRAELSMEFLGVSGEEVNRIDIQPDVANIQTIEIEARDDVEDGENTNDTIVVDAKDITDHETITSYYSDGDLKIENLTTLTSSGAARNTADITVKMEHTDNFNTDGDAADMEVLFDNDYLLAGRESQDGIRYFILDEDAELAGNTNRIEDVDFDGISFTITRPDGTSTDIVITSPDAIDAGTHQEFVNALQTPLQNLITSGLLPEGTLLTLNTEVPDTTFLDNGQESANIPAVFIQVFDGSELSNPGFFRVDQSFPQTDIYARTQEEIPQETNLPVTLDIELEKAGRGGEGGDLIAGGKSTNNPDGIEAGIEVFNIDVRGTGENTSDALAEPSDLGTITSTGGRLTTINIATADEFLLGDSFASLTVRNGFDQSTDSDVETGDLQLVNADSFLGDLTLGGAPFGSVNNAGRITNLDTLTAQGGGDVQFGGLLNGTETNQAYSYTTGAGNDSIDLLVLGDALDYAGSSLNVLTGAGEDSVNVQLLQADAGGQNEVLNQAILDNVTIDTGDGNDTIDVDGVGVANIDAGAGNDVIYSDGESFLTNAVWAMNFDAVRAANQGGIGVSSPDDLPGVQTSLAYLGGAEVTVTLSGAGIGSFVSGGGVMDDADATGAVATDDGYEASATITSLINGNEFYGDQRDINAAIIRAIETDSVLSNLLTATIGANNTLVISSTTSGAFLPFDLRVDIDTRDSDGATYAGRVVGEAQTVFSNSDISATTLFGGNTGSYLSSAPGADLETTAGADAYYDGLSVAGDGVAMANNLHTAGSFDVTENDNVIDGGAGNDLIVLSTDNINDAPLPFTLSSNNALYNGASNETVVLTGPNFGNDTVMNFTASGPTFITPGVDFLDYTDYLVGQENTSAAAGSASNTDILVSLGLDLTDVQANEVSIVTFDNTDDASETFSGLSASVLQQLFNNGGTFAGFDGDSSYGNLNAAAVNADDEYGQTANTDELVGGDADAIVMIENADNDGFYKVFQVSWNGDASSDDNSALDGNVTVSQLGTLDFGDSLTPTFSEVNLVGTDDYSTLISNGFQTNLDVA